MTPPLPASIKRLALAALLGGLLYAGYTWLNTPTPSAPPITPTNASDSTRGTPTTKATTPAPTGSLDAAEVAQAYARSPQEVDGRFKGQRIHLRGVVDQTEAGQGQVLLLTLRAANGQAGLRAVVNLGAQLTHAPTPLVGQPVGLDCLNQGLLMGEPVLSDCQLLN